MRPIALDNITHLALDIEANAPFLNFFGQRVDMGGGAYFTYGGIALIALFAVGQQTARADEVTFAGYTNGTFNGVPAANQGPGLNDSRNNPTAIATKPQ